MYSMPVSGRILVGYAQVLVYSYSYISYNQVKVQYFCVQKESKNLTSAGKSTLLYAFENSVSL